MAVVSRLDAERTHGFQAKVHKSCGTCARAWCYCHVKRSQFFADAKHGGAFFAEQLARQWCRDVARMNRGRRVRWRFDSSAQKRRRKVLR